jgi:outer membrane protein assembly factor BamB
MKIINMTSKVKLFNTFILGAFLFVFFSCSNSVNENYYWTKFRGADGLGIDANAKAPVTWKASDYNWQIPLPGIGNSSPIVWGNTIFVTSADNEKNKGYLSAINEEDGEILWQKEFVVNDLKMHKDNKLAFPTPAVDKSLVYIVWYTTEKTTLAALTHRGDLEWEVEFDGIICRHGGGSSLMLTDDKVVFTREQEDFSEKKSTWVAVSKKDGSTLWEIERESPENNSFATPFLLKTENQKDQLIFASQSHGIAGVDPETGEVYWERKDFLPSRVVASPFYSNGKIIVNRNGEAMVVDFNPETNQAADSALYKLPRNLSPYVPTPIVVNELLFLFMDNGSVACVQLATGELLWKERPAGAIYGSPICVDGNLYCTTKEGQVIVVRAAPTYQLLGVNELGDGSFSTPVMSASGMVFRTFTKLILL